MSVATSYARALFEAATEAGANASGLDQIERGLSQFLDTMSASKELQSALTGPVTASKDKGAIAAEVSKKLGLETLLGRFIELMATKNRLNLLSAIRQEFIRVRLDSEGGILGQLVSADPMGDDDIRTLSKAFAKKLGKSIRFDVSSDPALLAGMKVTVNGTTYDGTLRAQLERLRDRFVISTGPGAAQ